MPSESNAGPPRPWRCFAAASVFATLSACAGPIVPPPPDPPVVVDPAPDVAPAQADDPAQPQEPALDSSPAARAARLAGRPPEPGTGRDAPVRLIGLAREFVLELLGPAGFVRRDGPVQIWRYSGDDCFLDVFLFRESDAFRVNHVEARSKNANQTSVDGCYRGLVAARRPG